MTNLFILRSIAAIYETLKYIKHSSFYHFMHAHLFLSEHYKVKLNLYHTVYKKNRKKKVSSKQFLHIFASFLSQKTLKYDVMSLNQVSTGLFFLSICFIAYFCV